MKNLLIFPLIVFGLASTSAKASEFCGTVETISTNSHSIEVVLDNDKLIKFKMASKAILNTRLAMQIDLVRDSMNFGHTLCVSGSGKRVEIVLKKD